jgi:hypothetical protein
MVRITVPNVLAAEAGGRKCFDVDARTVGEALHTLPVADLLFNERDELRRHLNVYVDGIDVRESGGMACPLAGVQEVRLVVLVSGG